LDLYSDSTYRYIIPNFFNKIKEKGKYKFEKDLLILESRNYNNKDSILNIEYFCSIDNPETLKIQITNSINQSILTRIILNNKKDTFLSQKNGEYEFSYKELERASILNYNENISKFHIVYKDKIYKIDMRDSYNNSRKPEKLIFKLNDYVGQSYRPLIRKYSIKKDTIFINDISGKLMGFGNNRLIKTK
jgi:hypothetical protein